MLYFNVKRDTTGRVQFAEVTEGHGPGTETRNDWKTLFEATEVADALGNDFIAVDEGCHVSPRFDVIKLPQVGDDVSYGFNGDYYPCGQIVSISESLKLIKTSDGSKFYRVKETGSWRMNGTWTLVKGHVNKRNPSF